MTQPADQAAPPRIAAIETSGRIGSVAVGRGATLLAQRTLSPALRHAVELMPALESLCREQGWLTPQTPGAPPAAAAPHPLNLQHVYLSLGPGSFTGLRIAVAIARSLAQAIGCRLVGVPSLDVIAANAPPQYRVVVPVLDAKRGQIFTARFERTPAGALVNTAGPTVADPREFIAEALQHAAGEPVAILGEGVDYHRDALLSADAHRVVELDRPLWPARAAVVHHLGWEKARRNEFSDPQTLLPIYIRLPEAEELWRKKHGLVLE